MHPLPSEGAIGERDQDNRCPGPLADRNLQEYEGKAWKDARNIFGSIPSHRFHFRHDLDRETFPNPEGLSNSSCSQRDEQAGDDAGFIPANVPIQNEKGVSRQSTPDRSQRNR
jgi:hypothetical protein